MAKVFCVSSVASSIPPDSNHFRFTHFQLVLSFCGGQANQQIFTQHFLFFKFLFPFSSFLLCRLEDDWEEFAELVQEIEADQNHKEIQRIEVTLYFPQDFMGKIQLALHLIYTCLTVAQLGRCSHCPLLFCFCTVVLCFDPQTALCLAVKSFDFAVGSTLVVARLSNHCCPSVSRPLYNESVLKTIVDSGFRCVVVTS